VKRAAQEEEEPKITLSEAKQLLDAHGNNMLDEVRKMLPYMGAAAGVEGSVDMDMLAKMLAMRDEEVKELEMQLRDLQAHLSSKDRRVADLTGELDMAMREVRHRQLDLEFQQLKLEERVRSNAELEQAQKSLMARVDEAGLNARHAALDADMGRSMAGSMRLQGSLPWTYRKSRPIMASGFT
jgi:chromosome segregation ATPase